MLVRYLNNRVEQHVENALGRSLITAGLAEEVRTEPVAPEPAWAVVYDPAGFVAIRMELGTLKPNSAGGRPQAVMVAYYNGDPKFIHNRRDHLGNEFCSAFGRSVPSEIIKEYKHARKHARPDQLATPLVPSAESNQDMAANLAAMEKKQRQYVAVSEREALVSDGIDVATGSTLARKTVDGTVIIIPLRDDKPCHVMPEKTVEDAH